MPPLQPVVITSNSAQRITAPNDQADLESSIIFPKSYLTQNVKQDSPQQHCTDQNTCFLGSFFNLFLRKHLSL